MDEIDIAEFNSREAAKFSLDGLKDSRSRAHSLLLVLLGGGGGLGALGLAQWAVQPWLAVAAWAAAAWWFGGAAWVAWRTLTSDVVNSWAPAGMLGYHQKWLAYKAELTQEGKQTDADAVDPIHEVRVECLRIADHAREGHRVASTHAYRTLDHVYRAMAATPLVSGIAVLAFQRWG